MFTYPMYGASGLAGLTANLVSWWTLNETSGTRVDSHGPNDLTDTNTVTSATGKQGNAAQFNKANNEYLTVNSPTDLAGGEFDWSFACWAYFDSFSNIPVIVNSSIGNGGAGNQNDYIVNCDTGGVLQFSISVQGLGFTTLSGPTLSASTWYHIVASHDVSGNSIHLYVNNGAEYTTPYPDSFPVNSVGTDFKLGKYHTTQPNRVMDGRIDEASFWNGRILSADDRAVLWNGGSGVTYTDL